MKRFVSIILTAVLALSMITASAKVPEFMTATYNDYTADYSFTLAFESSEDLVALLNELEMPEEVNNFVDIKALLESLLSQGMQMKLQINMSDDYRKAEYALTADSQQEITVNPNLAIGIDSKMGMWLKMDLDAAEPVFQVIYSSPILNKYMVVDIFETVTDDAQKETILNALNTIFSTEYIDSVSNYSLELLEKYAEIKVSGATCTVKLDNDGLVAMVSELLPVVFTKLGGIMADSALIIAPEAASVGIIGEVDGPTAIFVSPEAESDSMYTAIPDMEGLQILGDEGITYKYSLLSGKISTIDVAADISFDISKFVTEVVGEEWDYEAKGLLDFAANAKIKLSKIGSTKVEFPKLTAENSFTLSDMMPDYEEEYYEEYEPSYPYYSVWVDNSELPVVDGEIYVPLRAVLENAYDDQFSIDYNKGTITMRSEYFPGFKKLTVYENSTMAFTDGIDRKISKVIVKNGTAYVGKSLFEDIFGWELGCANHDLLGDYYEAMFYTEIY